MNPGIPSATLAVSLLAAFGATTSAAQATQIVEDTNMGVRLLVPKGWTVESKSNGPYISCDPKKRGEPICYLSVESRKAAANQTTISDADREKFKKWSSAGGTQAVSGRDVKIGGYAAYETLAKSGRDTTQRTYVLMSSPARLIDLTFYATAEGRSDYYSENKAAMEKAISTLAPLKK